MPAPPSLGIYVRELRQHYGATAALRGVSFEARTGEIFGLLGPTTAPELGLRRRFREDIIRDRAVLYAKKYLGRLLGKIPG